jgi:hypothetical protein
MPRLVFASIHGDLDSSGGAAIHHREMTDPGKHGLPVRSSCSDNGMG